LERHEGEYDDRIFIFRWTVFPLNTRGFSRHSFHLKWTYLTHFHSWTSLRIQA